jgi:hypothetical protein
MNAGRKQLPPPDGGEQLAAALQRRLRRADDAPEPEPEPERDTPRTSATSATPSTHRTRARSDTPAMDRRSWYMPKASADALAVAVDDLYFATRRPKHEILAAFIDAALSEYPAVQARLTPGRTSA